MIRVVVAGATGRLGSVVCGMIRSSDDMELAGAVVSPDGGSAGREIYPGIVAGTPSDLRRMLEGADVYVDLTSPEAAAENLPRAAASGVNVIVGTTSVDPEAMGSFAAAVSGAGSSALVSANFAIGVNVFLNVSGMLARMLPGYDVEITETHHSGKRDAPSGTAAEALRRIVSVTGAEEVRHGREGVGVRGPREIGVHSLRAGSVVGDHTVMFAGNDEVIELRHRAVSRDAFAKGCLACIRWIYGRKDGRVHGMEEVIGA